MNFFYLKIVFRTLLIQSLWNYERMQNVGFAFSIRPFISKLYKDKIKQAERLKSHFGFFNTHPFLATLIIGIVMRLEEKFASGEVSSDEVIRTKTMLAGPIAAIGDRFIWSSWRVFCGIVAVALFLVGGKGGCWIKMSPLINIAVFLVMFNIFNLPLRLITLIWGYKYSSDVVKKLSEFSLQRCVLRIRRLGVWILLISSVIYSISLRTKYIIVLFWLNIFGAILIRKKFPEMTVFLILLFFDILVILILGLV